MRDAVSRANRRGMLGRVDTSIMLWALLRWEVTLGTAVLVACGVDLSLLERDTALLLSHSADPAGDCALDCASLQEVADEACREARSRGQDYVGTEHLVLALLAEARESLTDLFKKHGVTRRQYLAKLGELLGSGAEKSTEGEPDA